MALMVMVMPKHGVSLIRHTTLRVVADIAKVRGIVIAKRAVEAGGIQLSLKFSARLEFTAEWSLL